MISTARSILFIFFFLFGRDRVRYRFRPFLLRVICLFKKIEATDVFIFIGLSMIGTGLFFWVGHGIALTVVGFLLLGIGFFSGAIRTKK